MEPQSFRLCVNVGIEAEMDWIRECNCPCDPVKSFIKIDHSPYYATTTETRFDTELTVFESDYDIINDFCKDLGFRDWREAYFMDEPEIAARLKQRMDKVASKRQK